MLKERTTMKQETDNITCRLRKTFPAIANIPVNSLTKLLRAKMYFIHMVPPKERQLAILN